MDLIEDDIHRLRALTDLRERAFPIGTREVLDQLPVGVIVVNIVGQVVIFNAQAQLIFRYKEDLVMGKEIEMLLPERLREKHKQYRTRYLVQPQSRRMGGSIDNRMKLTGLTSDGVEIDLDISLSPMLRDTEMFIVTTIQSA